MARVCDHDVAAFEAIYDAYNRLVFGIAIRMLGDPMAAEDLTQAVFLKVWSDPASYRAGNFGAWLSRVTRNRSLDVLRFRTSHQGVELPMDLPLDELLDDTVFARLEAEQVRGALSRLPAEQRDLIELGFFGGITHEEIAKRTATPLGTVKTRIRAGLKKMRVALEAPVR